MIDRSATRIAFWPFILVDVLFLGLAYLIFSQGHRPLTIWEVLAIIVCAGIGAWSFLTPFLRHEAAGLKLAESDNLNNAVSQIKQLDQIAAQVNAVTDQLKLAQEESRQTADSAKQVAEQMAAEHRAFAEFLQKANDSEKNHLRLEVEKMRRAEVDWLQTLVHVLDHIFALNQAAIRSGKAPLIQQIGGFQNVCRESVRRLGLHCISPEIETPFDEKIHQLPEGETAPEHNAAVKEVLASGYSYQGRVVRRALVNLQSSAAQADTAASPEEVAVEPEGAAPEQPAAPESDKDKSEPDPQKSLF